MAKAFFSPLYNSQLKITVSLYVWNWKGHLFSISPNKNGTLLLFFQIDADICSKKPSNVFVWGFFVVWLVWVLCVCVVFFFFFSLL